jgi:hypothetical protein
MTGRRVQISIDVATLHAAGSVANYPRVLTRAVLPAEMFDADGTHPALADGGDVWASLTGSPSTRIPLDLIFFSTDNDPANGTAELWVRMPSDSDNKVWIHWGGDQTAQPDRDSTYGGDAVWSEHFGAVWRLHEDPQVITTILDRTGQGRTATFATGGVWDQANQAGMLNPCFQCYNGDGLRWAPFLCEGFSTSTISMQVEFSADTNVGLWCEGSEPPGPPVYWSIFTNGGGSRVLRTDLVDGTGTVLTVITGAALPIDTPFDYSITRSGNDADDIALLIDAVDEAVSFSGSGALPTFTPNPMGYGFNNLQGFASILVVATVARDGAWLTAWALMLADPTDGLTTGSPEDDGPVSSGVLRSPANLEFDLSDPINRANPDTAGLEFLYAPSLGSAFGGMELVRRRRSTGFGDRPAPIPDPLFGYALKFSGEGHEGFAFPWANQGRPYSALVWFRLDAPLIYNVSDMSESSVVALVCGTDMSIFAWASESGPNTVSANFSSDTPTVIGNEPITVGVWYPLGVVYRASGEVEFLFNGSSVASETITGHDLGGGPIKLGGSVENEAAPFAQHPITIGGAAMWSRQLLKTEFSRLSEPHGWLEMLNRAGRTRRYTQATSTSIVQPVQKVHKAWDVPGPVAVW